MCWNSARWRGSTQCLFFCFLMSEKHSRNKSIYDHITLPTTVTNDAFCSVSWTNKVWSSSSGMLALVGTLFETLHLYYNMNVSLHRRQYSVKLAESLLNLLVFLEASFFPTNEINLQSSTSFVRYGLQLFSVFLSSLCCFFDRFLPVWPLKSFSVSYCFNQKSVQCTCTIN